MSNVVTAQTSSKRVDRQPKRRLLSQRGRIWALRYGAIVLVLLAWEYVSGTLLAPYLISSPTEVGQRAVELVASGELLGHTATTVTEIAIGYPIGAAVGITVGYVLGSSETLARAFQPIVTALYGIPIIAIAPLIIVWLGIGLTSKVGVVALLVFFLTFFNTYSGLKNMDTQYRDLARLMGAGRFVLITRVVLPSIAPSIFTGLAIALPQSVIASTVAEFIAASSGIGFMIRRAAGLFDTPTLIVGALTLMVLVLIAHGLLGIVERRLLRWRPKNSST